MSINSSEKLRIAIEKAIEDLELTKAEFENIMSIANEDGIIDKQEHVLLTELQKLIETNHVKLVP